MTLRAYAKLNLLLKVLRRRPDGYHDLLSVMQTVSLFDRITLEPTEEEGIRLTCTDASLPTDEGNLAYRAALAFYGRLGWEPFLSLRLEKRIPAQAGLGGGSSDAAAVLNGLNRMHGVPLEEVELHALAATLGSDVPFFLRGGCAVVEGRGERLSPKPSLTPLHAVVVCPEFGVSTPWAYGRVTPAGEISPSLAALTSTEALDFSQLLPLLKNDLEAPVREAHPEIGEIEAALDRLGAMRSLMTGSGSAVFGLFPDGESARAAKEAMERQGYRSFAVNSVAHGFEVEGKSDDL